MITAKRLVLLLLTGIVIASVACGPSAPPARYVPAGPSASELREIALCEDALAQKLEYNKMAINKDLSISTRSHARYAVIDAEKEIDKYCK